MQKDTKENTANSTLTFETKDDNLYRKWREGVSLMFCVILGDGQSGVTTKGDTEGAQANQVSYIHRC